MGEDELRIGVFVCDCGLNIAAAVDTEAVRQYAEGLPDVVASVRNRYTCADPGQEEIKRNIREHHLNRVVVASCSPRLHEPTFRACVAKEGLNPYLFEMANIREHSSWIHSFDREGATRKAKGQVRMAVARAHHLRPQTEAKVPVTDAALVIGGGVAGIQAALDLANTGHQVYLVEKQPSIGGIMAQLDKTFPTIDCSICILGPKMMDAGRHPRIKLLPLSEVEEVTGYIGNFHVKVRKKVRFVDASACTACGECTSVCPVTRPDEYQMGLGTRKAIYIPFAQAVPSSYVINPADCLGMTPIACGKCAEKCKKKCIDYDMRDEIIEIDVGAVIVATGMEPYDPTEMNEYGYTQFENVVTSMEFERLICASGPTEGHFVRPGDHAVPKRIGFIQCVGSRMRNRGHTYCSNICCMNTVKDTLLLKEHYPDVELYVFYLDLRAFGKGFEDLLMRSREAGVRYIRGLPGRVTEASETGNLIVSVENTLTGRLEQYELDMLVLSIGLTPREDGDSLRQLLNISKTSDGFLMEAHPKLRPVDATTPGVFLAGCAEAPKDIKDSVTQASAAVARASTILNADELTIEAITAVLDKEKCTACGACARVCPYGAIKFDRAKKAPPEIIEAMCGGCGTCAAECRFGAITQRHFTDDALMAVIEAALAENPREVIPVFACNWCSYAGADGAGTARLQQPPNARVIRTMCSGRVAEEFILRAFELGAPIVLVTGCHPADCHYINANSWTQKRVDRLREKLGKLGIRPERLRLEWVSAAEGQKWAKVMREVEEMRQQVTAEEIQHTRKVLVKDH